MTEDEFAAHALVVNAILAALLKHQPSLKVEALAMLNLLRGQTNYSGAKEQAIIDEADKTINSL
jgi:hypothetical protein